MRRVTIFSFSLLVLLVFLSGCTLNNAQVKSKDTARVKNEDPAVQTTNRVPQSENGVPLLISIPKYDDAQTGVVEERALLGHWDVQTGLIPLEDNSLSKDKSIADPRFRIDWDSERVENENGTISAFVDLTSGQGVIVIVRQIDKGSTETLRLKPPLPDKESGSLLLLVSGKPDNFVLLTTYDVLSEKPTESGRLLLYSYNGSHGRWRKVKGAGASLQPTRLLL
ncbi:MAG: hypothetical protein IBX64_11640 [Actinobacteria bacterium]|nr:hypothetical protein [Actinomycetota bacterium]